MMAAGRRSNGEGSVPIKRATGGWKCYWTDERTGKRHYVYGKTSPETRRKRDLQIQAQREGKLVVGDKQTAKQYLEQWLTRIGVRDNTKIDYDLCVRRVLPYIGKIQLRNLSHEHLEPAYAAMRREGLHGKPCTSSTIRHTHKVIITALNDAVERDLISRNPAKKVSKNLVQTQDSQVHSLTRDQVVKFFESAEDNRHHSLWIFMLHTGCRRAEALAIKWSSVDWDNATVSISQAVTYVRAKESLGLEAGLRVGPLKTSRSRRVVSLTQDVLSELHQHLDRQRFQQSVVETWEDKDLVFCTETGGYMNPDTVTQAFGRALKRAGIDGVTLHSLRHTFSSQLNWNGVDIKAVSALMGHSSIGTTGNTYIDVNQEVNAKAVATLNGITRRQSV
jgi:integrase